METIVDDRTQYPLATFSFHLKALDCRIKLYAVASNEDYGIIVPLTELKGLLQSGDGDHTKAVTEGVGGAFGTIISAYRAVALKSGLHNMPPLEGGRTKLKADVYMLYGDVKMHSSNKRKVLEPMHFEGDYLFLRTSESDLSEFLLCVSQAVSRIH